MKQAHDTKEQSADPLERGKREEQQPAEPSRQHSLLQLQRLAGNRAVLRLMESSGQLQTKLRISEPADEHEHEADRAAAQVLRLSQAPGGVVQRKCTDCSPRAKCASCEEEEEGKVQRKPKHASVFLSSSPQIQRAPRNGNSPAADTASEPATAKAGSLIVDDDAATVGPGQMRKSEFLEQLRGAVCATADEALAEAGQSTEGCPYIEQWLGYYADREPAHIERALRKYAPEAASATSARDYIPAISNRVRRGVETWAKNGELTGVPDELKEMLTGPGAVLGAIGGVLGSIGSAIGGAVSAVAGAIGGAFSSIGKALFKRKEGHGKETDDSQAIQSQLRGGQPLDGGAQSRMGAAFGQDFSAVRVHTDSSAAGLSDQLNARAFTVGSDIAFGPGEYQPGTMIGDALLAHELAHVVQQGGEAGAINPKGEESGSESLEEEADDVAVGAVTSLWGERVEALKHTGRAAIPRLKSGLRLQRCSKEKYNFELYRIQFNRLWTDPAFSTLPDSFDPTLSSKGPRATRARKIFERIYADDPALKKAYDGNHSGVRERIDTYIGPEGLDIVFGAGGKTVTESPRLHALAAAFRRFDPPLSESEYASLVVAVRAASAKLDDADRRAVENSNDWQRLLLTDYFRTGDPNRPAIRRKQIIKIIMTPPPSPEQPKPPEPAPPTEVSADLAQNFVNNVSIKGPTSPVEAVGRDEKVKLTPHSTVPNPSVVVSTRFTVTPADRVKDKKNVSPPSRWPNGSEDGAPFEPEIINTSDVQMNAHLDLVEGVNAPSPAAPIDLQFEVQDKRMAFFLTKWRMFIFFATPAGTDAYFSGGPPVSYRGGAQQFNLSAWVVKPKWKNPGLNLSLRASIKRDAATVVPLTSPAPWPPDQEQSSTIYMPVSAPANVPKAGDPLTIRLEVIGDGNQVLDFKEEVVQVFAEAKYTKEEAEAVAAEDDAVFRSEDPKTGLRGIMSNAAELKKVAPGIHPLLAANTAEAIRSGRIKFAPMTRRHDSAAYVTAKNKGKPDPDQAGYFKGPRYRAAYDDPNSFVAKTSADGFTLATGDIVAERTKDVKTKFRRPISDSIKTVVHEGVHALDIRPSNTAIARYKTEFRAYWMDGGFGPPDKGTCPKGSILCKGTEYDPLLPPPGPKSPRARAIFKHLYDSGGTYDFVKENYDKNTDGFREAVDNYLIPDGINLFVSVRLDALRQLIEDYGFFSSFVSLRANVLSAKAKLDTSDLEQIRTNRAWRDLVERKVTSKGEQNVIKFVLGIP